MPGYDVDLDALKAVAAYISSEEDYVGQINLASVSDMLGMSVEGIDSSSIADQAGQFNTAIKTLAQDVAGYGTGIADVARAYGVSDTDVSTTFGSLA